MAGVGYPQHSTYIDQLTPCTLSDSPTLASLPPGIGKPQLSSGAHPELAGFRPPLLIFIYLLFIHCYLLRWTNRRVSTCFCCSTCFYMFSMFSMFFGLHQI